LIPWLLLSLLLFGGLAAVSEIDRQRVEALYPPIGRFSDVAGVRLHYTDSGVPATDGGPPVVLIHGASTSLLDFRASLIEPLSATHRVIALDRPGHGYSDRPAMWPSPAEQARLTRGLLAQLGVEQPVLVGHSWAGSVVLAYLLAYPDAAAGGVLLAGASHPWDGGVAWYNDLAGVPVVGHLFAHTVPLTLGRAAVAGGVRAAFAPGEPPDDYSARTGVALALRPDSFLANAEDLRRLSPFLEQQSTYYGYIRRPLLLVTGGADTIVPPWNHAERLLDQAPNAELVRLPGVGHALHHVARDRIVALIDDFGRSARP